MGDHLTIPGYYDIALRDFGLSTGALALARLAWAHRLEKLGEVQVVHEQPVAPGRVLRAA